MKCITLSFAFVLLAGLATGQNLVPNPSFEEYENCEDNNVQTAMEWVVDWFNPNSWSSDYYKDYELPCATNVNGLPNENWLAPQPFDGHSFVGSYYYSLQSKGETREYVSIQLTEALQAGQPYEVSWWLSLAGISKYRVNSFGAAFTTVSLDDQGELSAFEVEPQVEINDFFGSTEEWQQVVDTLWAVGGELYMTIGCFKHDNELGLEQINFTPGMGEKSYYVIDMAEVKPITVGTAENSTGQQPIVSFDGSAIHIRQDRPNVFEFLLYDITGKLIAVYHIANGSIDCHQFSSGLYFLKHQLNNKVVTNKILINRL